MDDPASKSTSFLNYLYWLFRWPVGALERSTARTLRLLGYKAHARHASSYTEKKLGQLIDRCSGQLRLEEGCLIQRVFDFSATQVREAMIPRTEMAAIRLDSSLEQIAKAFNQFRYSRLPVYRESTDDVVGFIHIKDVMSYLVRPAIFRIEDILQPPIYVVETARLEDVLSQMQEAKAHFGFVVDEHGGLAGILTLEDLLEEIVGEIFDGHDEEVNEQITPVGERRFILAGALAVRDLNRRLKLSLPESEAYMTIGGFLMSKAGRLLKSGEVIRHNGFVFQVERVERRRIMRVRLEIAESKPERAFVSVDGARATG